MALNKQMELFEDGGLRDEGGMIDETSGNDVPSGSTQEEVRDDIPAQLSEGEFVLPADVVRYHGLEKIMALRDEAKAGLAKMEAMGQMGNSEEATMPDDMPFSVEDLDMEDDEPVAEQEGDSVEMAEGGYVMIAGKPTPIPRIGGQLPPITTRPNESTKNMAVGGFTNPTGTYQVPTNIATQPSYFQNYAQSTAPFSPFNPVETPIGTPLPTSTPVVGQTGQGPSFNTLMPQLTGKRETKEYRNAAGQKLFIPFINDEPIYPIPEGYTLFTAEAVTQKPIQTTTQSTSVRQDEGGSDDPLAGTTSVRGLDNSIVSTDFANQTPDKVAANIGKMSSSARGKSVMDALQQSYGYTGLAKGMQQLGYGVIAATNPAFGVANAYNAATKGVNPMDTFNQIGQPNLDARNSIEQAFGAVNTDKKSPSYGSAFGYNMDDSIDANLAGVDQQNALNTAIFGGSITGSGAQTVAGINQVTDKDIASMYGIAPQRNDRGTYVVGTQPGQISSTGTYYSASGVGNDPSKAEYSSWGAMTNYTKTAGKFGYYGTLGLAIEQAKKGNKKAQAVVNAMRDKNAFQAMDARDKGAVKGRTDLNMNTKAGRFSDMKSGYGIGESTGKGSQNIGIEDVDVTSLSDQSKGYSNSQTTGGATTSGNLGDATGAGYGAGSEGTDTSNESNSGMGSVGMTYKGSLITKRKASGKLKPQYKKQGGLASR
jgi:hypothetical protein